VRGTSAEQIKQYLRLSAASQRGLLDRFRENEEANRIDEAQEHRPTRHTGEDIAACDCRIALVSGTPHSPKLAARVWYFRRGSCRVLYADRDNEFPMFARLEYEAPRQLFWSSSCAWPISWAWLDLAIFGLDRCAPVAPARGAGAEQIRDRADQRKSETGQKRATATTAASRTARAGAAIKKPAALI
jgi:hypothetical protein